MNLFRRDILRKVALILLAMCSVTAVAWPWSYWRAEGIGTHIFSNLVFIAVIERGSFCVGMRSDLGSARSVEWFHGQPTNELSGHSVLNFVFYPLRNGLALGVPLWLCSVLFGCCGVFVLRRARESLPGHCTVCGYDLRATPNRCPECGTVPPKKEAISR
jgi:hypothetical protein